MMLVVGAFFHNMLKMLYLEGRPYWEDADIAMKERKCPKDYGYPSGHAFMSCCWGFMIYFDLK